MTTPDGWVLEVQRGVAPGVEPGRPVLFVPGFGMNSWIFRYHPTARSWMGDLLDRGFDPWSVDLRGLSTTRPRGNAGEISLANQAFVDLPTAFDFVAEHTGHDTVHAIGCSLGGALLYAYGAMANHRIDRLVTVGTPLRWTRAHALVRAFAALAPASVVPIRGSRRMARLALPLASRVIPKALSIYLNPRITNTGDTAALVRTVEDPHPALNRQLARWIRDVDLDLGGLNVTDALRRFRRPLLVVAGGADGICPPEAALAAMDVCAGPSRSLVVGHAEDGVGHADLFISQLSPERVYAPVARWLTEPLESAA